MLNERLIDNLKNSVEHLEGYGHRGSATRNERKAAVWLKQRLDSIGIPATFERFAGYGSYGLRILLHFMFGLVCLTILPVAPLPSLLLTGFAFFSFVLETSGFALGLSTWLRIPSQNVVGIIAPTGKTKRRIVVCAHYDTQRSGWIWNANGVSAFASIWGRAPGPVKAPLFSLTLAFTTQLIVGILMVFGSPGMVPKWLIFALATYHVVGIVVVGQWSAGKYVPGANDNASGVACGLELAARWKQALHSDTELIVLFSGCEESGLVGASAWVRKHLDELRQVPTHFVNVDTVGCSHLHYLAIECELNGLVLKYPKPMLEICERIARDSEMESRLPHRIPTQTDGSPFLGFGIPGITITSSEEGMFVPHYHLLSDRSEYLNFKTIGRAVEFAWQFIMAIEGDAAKVE